MTIELLGIGWGQRNEGRGRSGQRNGEDKVVFWMVFQLHSPQT